MSDKPEYGSVEDYAAMVREHAKNRHDTYVAATALVGSIADYPGLAADERLRRIRNALAAAELVRDEMTRGGAS